MEFIGAAGDGADCDLLLLRQGGLVAIAVGRVYPGRHGGGDDQLEWARGGFLAESFAGAGQGQCYLGSCGTGCLPGQGADAENAVVREG